MYEEIQNWVYQAQRAGYSAALSQFTEIIAKEADRAKETGDLSAVDALRRMLEDLRDLGKLGYPEPIKASDIYGVQQ